MQYSMSRNLINKAISDFIDEKRNQRYEHIGSLAMLRGLKRKLWKLI